MTYTSKMYLWFCKWRPFRFVRTRPSDDEIYRKYVMNNTETLCGKSILANFSASKVTCNNYAKAIISALKITRDCGEMSSFTNLKIVTKVLK